MAIIRDFDLYLNAGKTAPLVIDASQYDDSETWRFSLYTDEGQPYIPTDVAIVGTKSDGKMIANAGTVSNSKAIIQETKQITAAAGKAVFELLLDGETHGTANFIVMVEESPTENGISSDSDLSLFEQAIGGISSVYIAEAVATWMDENLTPTTPVVDKTLTVDGAAADAKVVGDKFNTAILTQGVLHDADLNDLENSGVYALVSNYSYTNCPITAGGTLTVTRVSSSAIYQNIVSQVQGSWMRAKMASTGVWTSWSQVNTPVDNTLTVTGAAADAKNTGDEINGLRDAISQIDAEVEMTPVDITYELASVEDIPEGGGSTGGLAFDSGYQDAQGYIHLTKNGVDLPSSSFTPFKVSVGGDAETITAINAI